MIIKKVDIWHLRCKFRYPFKHKLATHTGSDNLVVRLTTHQGICGFGEGIPRDFVTGETLEASLAFLQENLASAILSLLEITSDNPSYHPSVSALIFNY